eukprot:112590-Rhodomonas_salina.1
MPSMAGLIPEARSVVGGGSGEEAWGAWQRVVAEHRGKGLTFEIGEVTVVYFDQQMRETIEPL